MSNRPFPVPRFSRFLYGITRLVGRTYLRTLLGVSTIEHFHVERFTAEVQAFKQGKKRLIIAFRHTAVEDAPLLLVGTAHHTHLSFLYGRDVLNWAGAAARLFFPRLSFMAVQNRGTSREGLSYLREAATGGKFPLALAPEGQVTYHAHRTDRIESGVANVALWAEQSATAVTILPVAIAYRYSAENTVLLNDLLDRWQKDTGYTLSSTTPLAMIKEACEHTLVLVATHWNLPLVKSGFFVARRDVLCHALLQLAETEAGLPQQESSIIDRLYRLRFAAEDTLFTAAQSTSAAEKEQARSYLIAIQTVDVLEYLDPSYLEEHTSVARMIEVALTLLDILNRLAGGSINTRYSPKRKVGGIYYGEPIDVGVVAPATGTRKERIAQIVTAVHTHLEESSRALEEQWTLHF